MIIIIIGVRGGGAGGAAAPPDAEKCRWVGQNGRVESGKMSWIITVNGWGSVGQDATAPPSKNSPVRRWLL